MNNHLNDDQIQEYIQATAPDRAVADHLTTCAPCRDLLSSYQSLFADLAQAEPVIPAQLAERVLARLDAPPGEFKIARIWIILAAVLGAGSALTAIGVFAIPKGFWSHWSFVPAGFAKLSATLGHLLPHIDLSFLAPHNDLFYVAMAFSVIYVADLWLRRHAPHAKRHKKEMSA